MIKRLLLFIGLLLVVPFVHAGAMSMSTVGGGFIKNAGGTYSVKGASATAANGAFITPATVTASGRSVVMSATSAFAANAAPYAVSALRLNPAGLMVSLAASWMLSKGLTYTADQWNKTQQGTTDPAGNVGFVWWGYGAPAFAGSVGNSAAAACQGSAAHPDMHGTTGTVTALFTNGADCTISGRGESNYYYSVPKKTYCYSGYTLTGGLCVPNPVSSPATEADFTTAGQGVLPDDVAQELARKDVPIPVNAPSISPTTVPDGEPYLDPLTGRMVQRHIEVRPSPTVENPERVEVTEYTKDAGNVSGQTAEPVAPTKEIVFPSDYARQGEAQQAADSINVKLDKMLEASPAPVDPTVPDPGGYTDFGTTFSSLLGWQLPGHTSQCPTAAFNTPWNTAYTIDSHCQLITNHWSALQAAMAVVWTIIALFIVLRA